MHFRQRSAGRILQLWYDKCTTLHRLFPGLAHYIWSGNLYKQREKKWSLCMKAVKTHVGRCDTCGEPAAYAQLLPGGRSFRFCEQHAPLLVKKQAQAASDAGQATDIKK